MLAPIPENFRSEMARYRLYRNDVASVIKMNLNLYSMFINSLRPLPDWAAHNIGWAINTITGMAVFNVDMSRGRIVPPRGRPKSLKPVKTTKKRRGKRYWRARKQVAELLQTP